MADQLVANLTKDVLDALRKETDELQRLLAETHLLDLDGQKGKSDLLRPLEQEISARMSSISDSGKKQTASMPFEECGILRRRNHLICRKDSLRAWA